MHKHIYNMKYEDDSIIIMYLIMDRGPYQNAPGKVSHLQVIRTYMQPIENNMIT